MHKLSISPFRLYTRSVHHTSISRRMDVTNENQEKTVKKNIARLQWRKPISDNDWYSKLKLFAPENDTNSNIVTAMQQPFDLSLSGIKKWYNKRQLKFDKHMQSFIPERHELLGNDLAAAHFIIHRGGSVKFVAQPEWVKMDEQEAYNLPTTYDPNYKCEAIKCDHMKLHYEGLENIRRLKFLKFISFFDCKDFDDWCLDRVSGSQLESLEVLDLTGTKITENGLQALYRIPTLKLLIFDSLGRSKSMELLCLELELLYPKLKIVEGKDVHSE